MHLMGHMPWLRKPVAEEAVLPEKSVKPNRNYGQRQKIYEIEQKKLFSVGQFMTEFSIILR